MKRLVVAALASWIGASMGSAAEGAVLRVLSGQRIQDALDRARWGDTVLVAPGTYREALRLPGGITLRGEQGWSETVLEGTGAEHVVFCEGIGDRVIEGFSITGGPAEGAALRALLLQEGHLAIRDCRFTENGGDGIAAILYGTETAMTVANTILDGNRGRGIALDAGFARAHLLGNRLHDNQQGGLWLSLTEWAEVTASGNEIADNLADDGAGIAGLIADGAVARLTGNRVTWNRARRAAGLHLVASAATVEIWNNLLYGNMAFEADGGAHLVSRDGASITFLNNTVVDNESPEGSGVVIERASEGEATLVNSVLWGNQPADLEGTAATYSVVGSGLKEGEGNVASAPRFLAPVRGDYRLRPGSPGVDAGSNAALPTAMALDVEGDARVVGAAVDCGAFELAPATLRLGRLADTVDARRAEGLISARVAGTLRMRAVSAEIVLMRFRQNGAAWALYHLGTMRQLVSEESGSGVAATAAPGLLLTIESIARQVEFGGG
jgi:hypothetical protein